MLIGLNMAPAQMMTTKAPVLAFDMWNRVISAYQPKGGSGLVALFNRLSTTKLDSGPPPLEHFNKLSGIADSLRLLEMEITPRWLACWVLASLPNEYETLRTILEQSDSPSTLLDPNEVQSSILRHHEKISKENFTSLQHQAPTNAVDACFVHPNLNYTNALCYAQHPHLKPYDKRRNQPSTTRRDQPVVDHAAAMIAGDISSVNKPRFLVC